MPPVQKSTLYYPDRAPVRVQVDVELSIAPEQVFATLLDYPSWKKWFPDVQACFESTPLPRVQENSPKYPLGSTRQINIGGLVFDEEIIAYEQDKVWAFSVFETSQALVNCMVERVVLEPLFDNDDDGGDGGKIVGTRVHYAAGLDLVWYLRPFLTPVLKRNMKTAWKKGFLQLEEYIKQQKK